MNTLRSTAVVLGLIIALLVPPVTSEGAVGDSCGVIYLDDFESQNFLRWSWPRSEEPPDLVADEGLVFPDAPGPDGCSSTTARIDNLSIGTLQIADIQTYGRFFFDEGATVRFLGPITVEPYGRAEVLMYFCPDYDDGSIFNGQARITSDAPGSPHIISLEGRELLEPRILTFPFSDGDTWIFAATSVGSCTAEEILTVANAGDGELNLTSVHASAPFVVSTFPFTPVAPNGGTTDIGIQFCPLVNDNSLQTGTLTIQSDDQINPTITIDLEGLEN